MLNVYLFFRNRFQVGQTFIPSSVPATFAPSPTPAVVSSGLNDLFELSSGIGMAPGGFVSPKSVRKTSTAPESITFTSYVAPPIPISTRFPLLFTEIGCLRFLWLFHGCPSHPHLFCPNQKSL